MRTPTANPDPTALALGALAWALADDTRAHRLLALTGIDADHLRATADTPPTLAAVLGFLEANERDLIACAAALDTKPEMLVAARTTLETSR